MAREPVQRSARDPARGPERESVRESARGVARDPERESVRKSERGAARDPVRDPVRDPARDGAQEQEVLHCPRCAGADTERLSYFGSTACKALYRCRACLEPFEYFKPL